MPPLQQSEFPLFSFTIRSVYAEFGRDAACRWCEMFRLGQLQEIQRNVGWFAVASAAFGQSQPDGGFANLAARRMLKFSFTFVCQAPSSSTEPSTWR